MEILGRTIARVMHKIQEQSHRLFYRNDIFVDNRTVDDILDELQWMAKQQYIEIEHIMTTSEDHEECFRFSIGSNPMIPVLLSRMPPEYFL